jgi:hypothetical protein
MTVGQQVTVELVPKGPAGGWPITVAVEREFTSIPPVPIVATPSSARAIPGSPLTLTLVAPPGSGGGAIGPTDSRQNVVITMDLGVHGLPGGKLTLGVSIRH